MFMMLFLGARQKEPTSLASAQADHMQAEYEE